MSKGLHIQKGAASPAADLPLVQGLIGLLGKTNFRKTELKKVPFTVEYDTGKLDQ